jgi:hypothetical protein
MKRQQISKKSVQKAIKILASELERRFEMHGRGAFVSPHEALGDLTEEYHELIEAIRVGFQHEIHSETLDVGVSALWALASQIEKEEK